MATYSGAECPEAPPSYDMAVQMAASRASLDKKVAVDAVQDPTKGQLISDSPHESDEEETSLLKAELRRLRLDKLEQTKQQLREQIGRERNYSGTGVSGAQSYGSPLQHQPHGYSSVPQITPSAPPANNAVIHPVAVPPPNTVEANKDTEFMKKCCMCVVLVITLVVVIFVLVMVLS